MVCHSYVHCQFCAVVVVVPAVVDGGGGCDGCLCVRSNAKQE